MSESTIEALIKQPKLLSSGFREVLLQNFKEQDVHRRSELKVTGTESDGFIMIIRISKLNTLDFSLILGYEQRETTGVFLLRRYNGKSHTHTNKIEGNQFRDFHIHSATERYQIRGFREEAYAEVTDRYSDLGGALNCMIADCGFVLPSDEPIPMF